MKLAIAHGKKKAFSETVNLTPNSKGCNATLAGTICTIDFAVAVGNGYVASMTTYDGKKGAGNALAVGQSVAFDVKRGMLNTVSLTLNGIPKAIRVKQVATNSILVTALDADGNFIVGPGAPTFAASKTSGSTVAAITQPTSTSPNAIAFAQAVPAPVPPATETIGITASYKAGTGNACAQSGAVCSLPSAVVASYQLSGTIFTGDYTNGLLKGFTTPLSGTNQAPAYSLAVPNAYAAGVASSGDVFGVDYGNGVLYAFKPPYTGTPATASSGVISSVSFAINSAGHVFVGDAAVAEIAPPYNGTPTSITSGVTGAYGLAVDAADNLYVANYTGGTLGVYAASDYTTEKYTVSLSSGAYSATRIGSKLYVGESAGLEIFSLPITSSAATPVVKITNGIGEAYSAALDASGNLFVSNYSAGDVTEYRAPLSSGEAPSVSIHNGLSGPCGGLTFDGNGFLYVIDYTAGVIDEFDPPFTNSSAPVGVTSPMGDPCYGGLVAGSSAFFRVSVP